MTDTVKNNSGDEEVPSGQSLAVIVYGTETGCAEGVARSIYRDCASCKLVCRMEQMTDQFMSTIPNGLILIIMSTAGRGDPPSAVLESGLWKLAMRKTVSAELRMLLSRCQLSMIGLGDSSYDEYNFASKKLYRRLLHLGAVSVLPLCLADEQHPQGPDGLIQPWLRDRFWKIVQRRCPLQQVPMLHQVSNDLPDDCESSVDAHYNATVVSNKRMTDVSHWQDVRLVSFKFHRQTKFGMNAVCAILPENDPDDVNQFFELTGLDRQVGLSVHSLLCERWCPSRASLGWYAERYLDLKRSPDQCQLKMLATLSSPNNEELERLQELSSDYDDYLDYCRRPRKTFVELLQDFPRTAQALKHTPFAFLFDLIHPIRARFYSVASNFIEHSGQVDILVAVVNYQTSIRVPRKGLCSTWLSSLEESQQVCLSLVSSYGFRELDRLLDDERPLIMIGPGTGLAPFRNICYSRSCRNPSPSSPSACKTDMLYFGCRNKGKDDYWRDAWQELVRNPEYKLSKYVVAYSRDSPDKSYVQHKLAEHGQEVAEAIVHRHGLVLIAGSSLQMPEDVLDTLASCLNMYCADCVSDGKQFLEQQKKLNLLQLDTWR